MKTLHRAWMALSLFLAGCASVSPKSYTLRLKPGEDLKVALAKAAKELQLKAGAVVAAVGSLQEVKLRLANHREATSFAGFHEILSLSGTLAEGGMHIHLSVSDGTGKMLGGHLVEGNLIYTTAEIVILEQPHLVFSRVADPTYGFKELEVRPR